MPSLLSLNAKGNRMTYDGTAPAQLESFKSHYGGVYSFPVCDDIYERLKEWAGNTLTIDEKVIDAVGVMIDRAESLIELAQAEDCEGDPRLFPWQRVAVRWFKAIRRGVLCDEQGAGKTVSSLMAMDQTCHGRVLVICNDTKRDDWVEHAKEWMVARRAFNLTGSPDDREWALMEWRADSKAVLVTNYKNAHTHKTDLEKAEGVIIDEAHRLRNRQTKVLFKTAQSLCSKASDVHLLTATPMINMSDDVWALLNLCDRSRFSSYWGFVYRFCEVTHDGFGLKVGHVRSDEVERLTRIIEPYCLVRSDLMNLPRPEKRIVRYAMSGDQLKLYEAMLEIGQCSHAGEEVSVGVEIARITRLRQLALHPALLFEEYVGPSKLDALTAVVAERSSKALVFFSYAEMLPLAQGHLKRAGISAEILRGGMTENARRNSLESFRSGSAQVLLLTHGVGGEGLNLVEADRVIFMELAWHPAGNRQAMGRIRRPGQVSERLEAIIIHTQDSIEDHILSIVRDKRQVTVEELRRRVAQSRK